MGAIITFVGLVLLVFCYFPPEFRSLHRHETKMGIFKHFDYVGMLLYSGGSSSLLLGLSWGGQRYRKALSQQNYMRAVLTKTSMEVGPGHCPDCGRCRLACCSWILG